MNILLGEDDLILERNFREFFERECPTAAVRAVEDGRLGYDRDLYAKMAGLGMLSLFFPPEYGGQGAHLFHGALLYECLGRALAPVPHLSSVVLAGGLIARAGSDAQKREILPAIGAGEAIYALALAEASGAERPEDVRATAAARGDGWVLDGAKHFVRDGAIADAFVVVARTRADGPPERGLSAFRVPRTATGLGCRSYLALSGDQLADLELEGCAVPGASLLGKPDSAGPALARVLDTGRALLAAQMVGAAEGLLERTVAHTAQRIAFGRPIGSFQALQHRLARLKIQLDGARLLSRKAAWLLGEGQPAGREAAAAKAAASALYRLAANEAVQMHGGYGVAKDHDIQLFWRRHKAQEVYLGDSPSLKEEIAAGLGI
jgi:alkylation response protein AidB-like acyl-CoA dehydrogenase